MKRFAVLLVALAVFGTACQAGNVFSLAPGDCFNNPDALDEVSDVEIVECGEAHDNEVYAAFDIPGSSFPGQSALQTSADDGCFDRFEPYVGASYAESSLVISHLTPTEASWGQDDREVLCFLFDINGAKLMTSVKGTGI